MLDAEISDLARSLSKVEVDISVAMSNITKLPDSRDANYWIQLELSFRREKQSSLDLFLLSKKEKLSLLNKGKSSRDEKNRFSIN